MNVIGDTGKYLKKVLQRENDSDIVWSVVSRTANTAQSRLWQRVTLNTLMVCFRTAEYELSAPIQLNITI